MNDAALASLGGLRSARALRVLGTAGALGWVGLALLHASSWPWVGGLALAAAFAVTVAVRPLGALVTKLVLAAPRPAFVSACALAAGALSWWVVHATLHDRPLSIDAGVYLLQARALAHGHLGVAEPLPAQAFGDHFLLEGPDQRLYGVFPPGWPLALVPFVWLGRPMLAGPVLAVALIAAQAWLGRALTALGQRRCGTEGDAGELAMRASLLLSLPSIGRALETADLLSHAWVAVLACVAMACALDIAAAPADASPARGRGLGMRGRGALLGLCLGWALASRLLDGVVLALAASAVLVWSRGGRRAMGWSALGAAPLLALLLLEQHAATGAWLMPTQTLYFARTDWPPTCHRLGFGLDVGCTVEHTNLVARLGGHGFGPAQGLAVTRERAASLGDELFGFAPLALVAFLPVALAASAADAVALAFVLALTLAYGLFYYGNSLFFGARHLFPAAPFLWLLAARGALAFPRRARGVPGASRVGAAALVAVLVAAAASRGPWRERSADAEAFQVPRPDLRRALEKEPGARGIVKTRDATAMASAFDPEPDGDARFFALEDGAGLLDLRRAHPDLPLFLALPGDELGRLYVSRPAPGLLMELERAWPTFVRPRGLSTRASPQEGAGGSAVLLLSHAAPGGEVTVPFDVTLTGSYALRVDGFTGPDQGDYDLLLDGDAVAPWHGYSPEAGRLHGQPVVRALAVGRHTLVVRCAGRDASSGGFDARLDALVGEPAEE